METVFRLVVDPVLIPALLAVFPLERRQSFGLEEINEKADGRVFQVFRGIRGWRRGIEGQGVQTFGRDGITPSRSLEGVSSPQYTLGRSAVRPAFRRGKSRPRSAGTGGCQAPPGLLGDGRG